MSWGKGHKDGGKGGKLGHTNMAYWGSNEEAKEFGRKQRRQDDRAALAEGQLDAEYPDRKEPYRRIVSRRKLVRRTDGNHCPVCLARLRFISTKSRRKKSCDECEAHFSERTCVHCGHAAIWENKQSAACQHCGAGGRKVDMIESR